MKYTVWVWTDEEWMLISRTFTSRLWEECVTIAASYLKATGPLARIQIRPEAVDKGVHKAVPNIATLIPTQRLRTFPYTIPARMELERAGIG